MTDASAITIDRVLALVDEIPASDQFPAVDDLLRSLQLIVEERPSVARWNRIGTSRLGEPIHSITVGNGRHHAVVFGGVHPNEPIGGLTALHLARTLTANDHLRNDLDYTWHIVGCIDPDGTRLNEGWFGSANLNRGVLGRHFYRPPFNEQVAWTFPLRYKQLYFDQILPETLALMRLIDDTRPTFMCALHNGESGGAYYFLTEEAPTIYPILHALPAHVGIPLNLGEPEVPYVPRYAPAIFGHITMEDQYEYALAMGLDPRAGVINAGSSSESYAVARHGTLALVAELPYWATARASDPSPSTTDYAALLRDTAAGLDQAGTVLAEVLDEVERSLQLNTPFLRAVRPFVRGVPEQKAELLLRAAREDSRRPATVAEEFSAIDGLHSVRTRYGGMTLRLLEAEIGAGYGRPSVRKQLHRMRQTYDEWATAANDAMPSPMLRIKDLASVQYGAILAAADYARRADREARLAAPECDPS